MATTTNLNALDPISVATDPSGSAIQGTDLLRRRWRHVVPIARRACETDGFLCIDLDRRSRHVLDSTLEGIRRFFALDDERKANCATDDAGHGWSAPFLEPAYQPGTIANVESFDVQRSAIESPGDVAWPQIEGFAQAVAACWNEYLALGDAVLELLANVVGAASESFVANCGSRELNTMRLLHYPPARGPVTEKEVGIAAHTDFECITLLYQTAPGLELRHVDARWHDAAIGPDRLVVLFGDMLEIWTNGLLPATGHRVRRTFEERFSIVMFLAVDDAVTVAPLRSLTSGSPSLRYTPVRQAAHIDREIERARKNRDQHQ